MEVECWHAKSSITGSISKLGNSFSRRVSIDGDSSLFPPPDIVIPFTGAVDIGVRTNVRKAQSEQVRPAEFESNVMGFHCG